MTNDGKYENARVYLIKSQLLKENFGAFKRHYQFWISPPGEKKPVTFESLFGNIPLTPHVESIIKDRAKTNPFNEEELRDLIKDELYALGNENRKSGEKANSAFLKTYDKIWKDIRE